MTAKIVSVVSAIILWLIITLNSPFTYKVMLPITYVGPSEGFIMSSEPPGQITVLLKGSGRSLFMFSVKEMLAPEKNYALVSLTGLSTKGEHHINLSMDDIHLNNQGTIEIESILINGYFSVTMDRVVTRSISVNTDSLPDFDVEKNHVVVGSPVIKPELIVVTGPEKMLNTMSSIHIESYKRDKVTMKNPVLKAHLLNDAKNLLSLDPEVVDVIYAVEPLIKREFSNIPLTLSRFPTDSIPVFIPDTFSVSIEGPESIVSTLAPGDIEVMVRFASYLEQRSHNSVVMQPEIRLPVGLSGKISPESTRISDSAPKS
ncbi:hypothetical protein ACFL47_05775 [Candidatus Latescibacterota bacterium]